MVHPSPTSLPFSARNSRIHNGTAQRGTEVWATINEWLFFDPLITLWLLQLIASLKQKPITGGVFFSVTEEEAQKNDL